MDKSAIRNFAIEARRILMKTAVTEAGFYGISKDECRKPVQQANDFEVYETLAATENRIFGADIRRRQNLVQAIQGQGFDQVIEETAYTWFNRIIAIRFMEVNDYLPTRIRVLSSETGSTTPDIVTQSLSVDLNMTEEEVAKVQQAKDANQYDEAFRLLFIKQCNELNAILPGLFEKTDDYMELLLKLSYTGDGVVRMLVDSIPEDNFNVEAEGQVEIIGWMYQYYNTELKDDTFAKLKKNVKITKERIPAATQLFTPDWIVRYMVENSLGRVWIEHLRAVDPSVDEKAKAEEFGWKYYLPEAEQEADVAAKLVEIRASYKDLTPQDISCIDPCMGSGHILVYMFDVLMDIYRSEGFSERDAVFDILEKNIRGLDIDRRAFQLSYFALMMKAKQYNRVFFRGKSMEDGSRRIVEPFVYAIEESNGIEYEKEFGDFLLEEEHRETLKYLLQVFKDAKEYGSILQVEERDYEGFLQAWENSDAASLENIMMKGWYMHASKRVPVLAKQAMVMSKKYDAVVTNPPYVGASNLNPKLLSYIKDYYSDYKSDIFSAFIVRNMDMAKKNGYLGFLSPYVWMFILSYEKLRQKILKEKSLVSLIQFEYSAFEEAIVPICTFILYNSYLEYKGNFVRLTDYKGGMEIQRKKTIEAIDDHSCGYYYETSSKSFFDVPGNPIAYWQSDEFFRSFKENNLGQLVDVKKGLTSADNNRFLRYWWEVVVSKTNIDINNFENRKWIKTQKGGEYRKWFGNSENVINWENDGLELKGFSGSVIRNPDYYGRECVSWNDISSAKAAFRLIPSGSISNASGPSFYGLHESLLYLIGLCNSKVVENYLTVLCPTIHFEIGQIAKIPVKMEEKSEVERLADNSINLSKADWNSFEISWDFEVHPLVRLSKDLWDATAIGASMEYYYGGHPKVSCPVELCFMLWQGECNERFKKLKENEEELNRIFIEIYGLQDELTPEVEDKDITVRKADLGRDIRSLISYAVGCMFGRYSILEPGLIFAGGAWPPIEKAYPIREKYFPEADQDVSSWTDVYGEFIPDLDAIIPITDEAYFEDDIVNRFVDFIEIVFGSESLESNLDYIAKALGKKGETSREIIRNYFLEDFFKDHCNTYSVTGSGKRPIYWLFDSGKQNGFKCLIYLHRYHKDMVGMIRSDYLTKVQSAIENALKNAEYSISTTQSAVDRAGATKRRDKYIKQLAEIKTYYQALSHIALQRIELDLDDGVKVNYAKFQGIEVGGNGEKKQKIDLLAKI